MARIPEFASKASSFSRVLMTGVEPAHPFGYYPLKVACLPFHHMSKVPPGGIEPPTRGLRVHCSTNWAIGAWEYFNKSSQKSFQTSLMSSNHLTDVHTPIKYPIPELNRWSPPWEGGVLTTRPMGQKNFSLFVFQTTWIIYNLQRILSNLWKVFVKSITFRLLHILLNIGSFQNGLSEPVSKSKSAPSGIRTQDLRIKSP